ncbi:MBOAT family O-acyltransferase [Granulicella arctica]|uniref:D-alanyl-lipoteichoic acid acyltransferase DltB (MBOAT superfamily) n=1 Tax=Granulicella arctica TaxID=940613 RepID=A0A7Y9TRL9_9BACT|nr:MBOAT family protein [Granulicella arctica]NYF78328.1 D-alanyl-lipoteichoic acid acyltransferase DltB (MBOAT superfamily) [Granulicella arctica]
MQLSTSAFFVFFLTIWLLYWATARFRAARLLVLVAANGFFLAKFGLLYLALPAAASVDFCVGIGLSLARSKTSKRLLLAVSLAVNLALLLTPKFLALRPGRSLGWLLTLSLSFYCFQSLTYTIDLYRGDSDAKATRNLLAYLSSALFFPVLVAGPIMRLHTFLKQLLNPPTLTNAQAGRALLLIGIGLVKKLLIADFLGQNLVARVFDTPTLYSGAEVLTGVYGYALQLFFDFSGYTDIAVGVGLLLGLDLPENFRQPYLSINVMEFWRRWHITFSEWLRDYLMDSLPQRRRQWPLLSYSYSVIVTMMLGGLWHGLSWTFLIWGALHGVALAVVRLWKQYRKGAKPVRGGKIAATLLTFHFVCFTWIFFNSSSVGNAIEILQRIGSNTWSVDNLTLPIVSVMLLAAIAHCLPLKWLDSSAELMGRAPFWLQGAVLAGLVLLIQTISGQGSAPFVYGNF